MTTTKAATLRELLLFSTLVVCCLTQDQCVTPLPPQNSKSYAVFSSGLLQIFRTLPVKCFGNVQIWGFQSSNISLPQLPIFSVWEQSLDKKTANLQFKLIGATKMDRDLLIPQGLNWYTYSVPVAEQFAVDPTRPQFIGIYYEQAELAKVTVNYLTPKANVVNTPVYRKWDNSTIIGLMNLDEMIANLTATGGYLRYNRAFMVKDYRLPNIQAFIGKPTTTTEATTTTTTTKARTAITTTTTTTTSPPISTTEPYVPEPLATHDAKFTIIFHQSSSTVSPLTTDEPMTIDANFRIILNSQPISTTTTTTTMTTTTLAPIVIETTTQYLLGCGHLPDVPNCWPTQDPIGVIGERIPYQCSYENDGFFSYTCTSNGKWVGSRIISNFQPACYLPFRAGTCSSVIRQWWYDKDSATCKPFFYSGCSGNANRFDSEFQCISTCKTASAKNRN